MDIEYKNYSFIAVISCKSTISFLVCPTPSQVLLSLNSCDCFPYSVTLHGIQIQSPWGGKVFNFHPIILENLEKRWFFYVVQGWRLFKTCCLEN